MHNNIVEHLRREAVEQLFKMDGFQKCYDIWKKEIEAKLKARSSRQIMDLGDELSEVFKLTRTEGRSQSDVSGGGNAWEALVCWYLNLCLIGRSTVVIKHHKKLIPVPVADAITVNYNSFVSNTESDLIAITFPMRVEYEADIKDLTIKDENGKTVETLNKKGQINTHQILNALCHRDFSDLEIHIIQCKTNWNDNAQIPMLWDMIYSANDFRSGITLGKNGYDIHRIKRFSYSFVTVPSNKKEGIKATSTCVKRVSRLSGGNYWGYKSVSSVANSVKEMLSRNLSSGNSENILTTLSKNTDCIKSDFAYFKLF